MVSIDTFEMFFYKKRNRGKEDSLRKKAQMIFFKEGRHYSMLMEMTQWRDND